MDKRSYEIVKFILGGGMPALGNDEVEMDFQVIVWSILHGQNGITGKPLNFNFIRQAEDMQYLDRSWWDANQWLRYLGGYNPDLTAEPEWWRDPLGELLDEVAEYERENPPK